MIGQIMRAESRAELLARAHVQTDKNDQKKRRKSSGMFLSWWANPGEPWVVSPAYPQLLMMSLYMPILMLWMIWKMAAKHKHRCVCCC